MCTTESANRSGERRSSSEIARTAHRRGEKGGGRDNNGFRSGGLLSGRLCCAAPEDFGGNELRFKDA